MNFPTLLSLFVPPPPALSLPILSCLWHARAVLHTWCRVVLRQFQNDRLESDKEVP